MTCALVSQGPPSIQADELVRSFKRPALRSKARHSLPADSNLCEYDKVLCTWVAQRRVLASLGPAPQFQHAAPEQKSSRFEARAASVAAARQFLGPSDCAPKSHSHAPMPTTPTRGARGPHMFSHDGTLSFSTCPVLCCGILVLAWPTYSTADLTDRRTATFAVCDQCINCKYEIDITAALKRAVQ